MKIEPHKQFPHSESAVGAIAKLYGLKFVAYSEASSGIENTTLIIDGTDDSGTVKRVLRIYRMDKKSTEHVQAELDFMAYLRSNGIPIPIVFSNDQLRLITEFEAADKQWQVIAMEHITGVHAEHMTDALIQNMAEIQARMHLLASRYETPTEHIRTIKRLIEREFVQQIDQSNIPNELQAFLRRAAEYELILDDDLPIGPCHFDYDEQNILCEGDVIKAVLDFDDLSVAPYVVCLAYTLWHVNDRLDIDTVQKYVEAYESIRPLTSHERQFLYPAMLFRHYMISAIKILNGETAASDIRDYVETEQVLSSHR